MSLQRSRNPAPPFLGRVPAGMVRRLRLYYKALRFPVPRLVSLLLHSLRDTATCACVLLPPFQHAKPAGLSWVIQVPVRTWIAESPGRPKFPGNLDAPMPCSITPAGPSTLSRDAVSERPPFVKKEGLPRVSHLPSRFQTFPSLI